MGNREVEARSI